MRKSLPILLLLLCYHIAAITQTVSNPGNADSLYPVGGKYYQYVSSSDAGNYNYINFGVFKTGGKYIVNGDFKTWSDNNGSALVIDTLTNNIINNRKWRVNGEVRAVVPDGTGGFFIAGDFNGIGDSSRKFIAQIDANGKPTAWKATLDSSVNAMVKRNDTLFIGGYFTTFNGTSRPRFAMCKTSGTLLYHGTLGSFSNVYNINTLLIKNDTLIYGGRVVSGTENIRKYNFKNYAALAWATPFTDFSEVKHLQLSADGTVLIYAGYYNNDFIKGVSNGTGAELYNYNISLGSSLGNVLGFKQVGNKIFAYGDFVNQSNAQGTTFMKGIFAFNGTTGTTYPDNLNLDGFVSFMYPLNNRIFISGKFNTVNGTARNQFAVLDTGTYNLGNLQLSISDPVAALAFGNGNTAYIAGNFSGMHAVNRNSFIAIDSATRSITPWSASISGMQGNKRMFARGDSLFVLYYRYLYSGCAVQSETTFKIYSLTTGAEYGIGGAPAYINDMLLDGNYLYVSQGVSLRRYLLPALVYDASWGTSWQFTGYSHSLFRLFSDANKIYAVGDSRYTTCASSLEAKRGFVDVYNKTNGQVINYYVFTGANPDYDNILFSEAELLNNKMYVQGQFKQLNGTNRWNFACIDVNNGSVTSWNPTFQDATSIYSFYNTTNLKYCKGKIWFGCGSQLLGDGSTFGGFGAIDTLTAAFTQPIKTRLKNNYYIQGVYDFLISESEIVLAGVFDSANARPVTNFAVFKLTGSNTINLCGGGGSSFTSDISGSSYQWQMDQGSGFTDISNNANFSGVQTATLQLTNIPGTWYGYKLRCHVDNAYSDIFQLKFKNTWTGAVNNNWENPGNWQCGSVPDANTDVVINSGTVVVNNNTTISSLSLQPGVSLTIAIGVIFNVIH